jgi:hypothetical protein
VAGPIPRRESKSFSGQAERETEEVEVAVVEAIRTAVMHVIYPP